MFRTWTRLSATFRPAACAKLPGRRLGASLLLLAALPSCNGSNETENRIKPVMANLQLDVFPGTPDPAIYFEKQSTTGDLVTLKIKLHNSTGSPINFDAFNLEIAYDFRTVHLGDVFELNPDLMGTCHAGGSCDPQCLDNATLSNAGDPHTLDANGKAHFIMGVAALPGCPTASVGSSATDTTILTLAFIAATTIDPPGSRIEVIPGPTQGGCGILNNLLDLGVSCVDPNAMMTASR